MFDHHHGRKPGREPRTRPHGVILDGPRAEASLDPGVDLDGALELVRPLPDGRLEVYAVSPRVNNGHNEDADLTQPLSEPA